MPGGHSPAPQTVLIETLWNVNTGYTAYIKDGEMY